MLPNINASASYPLSNFGPTDNGAGFIQPYKLASGSMRGTQGVGFGNVKIDSANNRISVGKVTKVGGAQAETILGQLQSTTAGDQAFGLKITDDKGGQLLVGILPDGNLGIQLIDPSGNEVMRAGFLPVSGIYGWATSTPGNSLAGQV